ncbi:MAG: hypothetical protein JWQ79_2910 [Mucilaginibacter sp.]|nr:hypothetical protein [Mucilaginibacter sp.]
MILYKKTLPANYTSPSLYTCMRLPLLPGFCFLPHKSFCNYSLHKKLGIAGGVLAGVMVILGSVTGVVSEHVKYGTPDSDPAFLAVMFGDMLLFGILAGAGIALRKDASAHKRLMLLATIVLTDAGTGRWFSFKIAHFFGNLYWEGKAGKATCA